MRQLTVVSVISIHVYLLDTPEGVVVLDSAIKGAGEDILAAAGGRVARLILSHGHIDHRGAAPELGAPVHCHVDAVEDVEGDGGRRYTDYDLLEDPVARDGLPRLHEMWDGGPVATSGPIEEGDEIAGFRVVDLPGHAPGQIGLYRDDDRLLLAPDVVFTLDEVGQDVPARVPPPAFNWDTDLARASIDRVRGLEPAAVWIGHGEHLSGDVDAQLDAAAAW